MLIYLCIGKGRSKLLKLCPIPVVFMNNENMFKSNQVQPFSAIQDYYCLVEYATPILSLYEMSNSEEAGLSSFDRLQQMRTFVATLQEIINSNPETKDNCSLLVYDGKRNSLCVFLYI